MNPFSYTLVSEGTSDRCLMRVIDFVLGDAPELAECGSIGRFAEPFAVKGAEGGLAARMRRAVALFPCDVLFVHRDADREDPGVRVAEVRAAAAESDAPTTVAVVPVRMTEAWLMIDERAVRRAADNPNGQVRLELPPLRRLERLPDPKETLFDLLIAASEKRGRRLQQFRRDSVLAARRARVADLISDFSPLRELPAFVRFEEAAKLAVGQWASSRR